MNRITKINKTVWIYVFKCPKTRQIRYIGKTVNLKERYRRHIIKRKLNTHTARWINKLYKENLRPIIKSIYVTNEQHGSYWEKFYIKKFRKEGCCLTNITEGGEGGDTYTNNPRKEELLRKLKVLNIGRPSPLKGKKASSERIKNLKKAWIRLKQRGFKYSKERNQKISKALKGIKRPEETKNKLKELRKETQSKSDNHNAKIFILESPAGKKYKVYGELRNFCYKSCLSYKGIIRVHQGKQKMSKGWKCIQLSKTKR